jgi:IS5 family transposase
VRKGTIIDASVIGSAAKGDEDAAWVKHRTRPPVHGYKANIAADKDTGIIRAVETTLREFRSRNSLRPENEADVSIAPSIIPDAPGHVFGDKAYDAASVKEAIKAKGGSVKILRKGHRWLPPKKFLARNRKLAPIRARIEKIFGTWKRSYHFRAMRWVGLAKARCQVHLAVIAYNVRRYWRLQSARAVLKLAFNKAKGSPGKRSAENSGQTKPVVAPISSFNHAAWAAAMPQPLRPPPRVRTRPSAQMRTSPRPGLVSRETFWYDWGKKPYKASDSGPLFDHVRSIDFLVQLQEDGLRRIEGTARCRKAFPVKGPLTESRLRDARAAPNWSPGKSSGRDIFSQADNAQA